MNTKEFIKEMSDNVEGGTQTNTKPYFDAFWKVVKDNLAKGKKIQLQSLISFEPKEVSAREKKNPKTGESIQKSATKKVKITQGSTLKECVK